MFLIGFTQAQNIQEKSIEYNNLMPNGIVKISIELVTNDAFVELFLNPPKKKSNLYNQINLCCM